MRTFSPILIKKAGRIISGLLILILLAATQQITGQTKQLIDDPIFTIDAAAAIDSLYNRNNTAAREILSPWMREYPEHPLWTLWAGIEIWWKLLEDLEVEDLDEVFVEKMREADFEAGRLLRNEPDHVDALVIRAVSNSYIARMYANRERWITSIQIGRRGYQAHLRLMEVSPNLPDNFFAEGMKLYYSAYIPDEYPIVRPFAYFLPAGDRQEGMELLREAMDKALFSGPEAAYFLATILLNYEGDRSAAKVLFRQLVEQYPDNGYYRRIYMNTLAQLREYFAIIAFHEETMRHWSDNRLSSNPVMEYEFYYWLGRAQHFYLDNSSSFDSFVKALDIAGELKNRENRSVYTLAAYFAGSVAEELDMNESALKYYNIVISQKAAPEAVRRARSRIADLDS